MISTILFLWRNREVAAFFSKRWFVVWIKRVLRSPSLLHIFWIRLSLQCRGTLVGDLSLIYKPEINGKFENLKIGKHTFISQGVHFATHAEICVGSFVCINNGVRILSASHDISDPLWRMFSKSILIDDYAWIATGATLLPGVHIGRGAVVGAGAVVTHDVPAYAVATGNPAELMLNRRTKILRFDPVIFSAPYEAWIGRNATLKAEMHVSEVLE